jgi:hypothetical protein
MISRCRSGALFGYLFVHIFNGLLPGSNVSVKAHLLSWKMRQCRHRLRPEDDHDHYFVIHLLPVKTRNHRNFAPCLIRNRH